MVVKRSKKIPGGYRVVLSGIRTEDQARRLASTYSAKHEAIPTARLYEIREAALREQRANCKHTDVERTTTTKTDDSYSSWQIPIRRCTACGTTWEAM